MKRLLVANVLLAAAACTSSKSSGNTDVHALKPIDTKALIGAWKAQLPDGPAGYTVTLGTDLIMWQKCGEVAATWSVSPSGGFIAQQLFESQGCGGTKVPAWIHTVQFVQSANADFRLLDATGNVLVTLTKTAFPSPGPDIRPELAQPSATDPEIVTQLANGVPHALPSGWAPATREDLLGVWIPPNAPAGSKSGLRFKVDGSIVGSDGCNGVGGTFAVPKPGEFLAVQGASTLIGCAGVAVGGYIAHASSVGKKGDLIGFFDHNGKPTGQLRRSPDQSLFT